MAKKTYNEKLNNPGDLPRIEDLSDKPEAVRLMGPPKNRKILRGEEEQRSERAFAHKRGCEGDGACDDEGGTKMLIAAPLQYNEVMARIPNGKLTTVGHVRAYLAAKAGADTTCPLTAGIFTNICAHASEERTENKIPWWRTLKAKGELNEKYPSGQREKLEAEGHTVVQKGRRHFVYDYENNLADLEG